MTRHEFCSLCLIAQRLIFRPAIFHPIVDPVSGELDVHRAFAKWKRNVNHIWQVLLYARRIFYKIDTKEPLNPEAAVLWVASQSFWVTRWCAQELYFSWAKCVLCSKKWKTEVQKCCQSALISEKTWTNMHFFKMFPTGKLYSHDFC